MKMKKRMVSAFLSVLTAGCVLLSAVGCSKKGNASETTGPDDESKTPTYNTETRPFSMSIQTPDGVFNPFFSSSAYDSTIISHTQVGMLSTDPKGNIVCGENEPTVALDYSVKESTENGKTYTTYKFLIKNGILFSDGKPLTIKDVLFNLYVYLDPAYTGSATIYSTDIVGLQNYRQQKLGDISDGSSSSFDDTFVSEANVRIQNLIDYVKVKGKGVKNEDKPPLPADFDEAAAQVDYKTVAETFRKELEADYNAVDKETYKDWKFTEIWQIFLYNDGGRSELLLKDEAGKLVKDENQNPQLDPKAAQQIWDDEIKPYIDQHPELSQEDAIKAYCIGEVYNSYFPDTVLTETKAELFESVLRSWGTASTILDLFTAEAKSNYFSGSKRLVPNISGITTESNVTEFNGETYDEGHDVLCIKINDVDPKAIFNFSFTVSPMHYYSTDNWNGKNYIEAFDGVQNFGLEFGSIEFMNKVINAPEKVGLPVGAGPYMASNASGSGKVTGDTFFNNNFVYYERNPHFHTLGSGISNAKIKYMRYKVVDSDQIINALANGDIDFGDPNATQENIQAAEAAGLGHVEIKTSGYGYVGINPRFIPSKSVRQAIMMAMNTVLIAENYYKGGLCELIYRPMSTTSWAYPTDATKPYYNYDSTGYEIRALLEADGYQMGSDGIYKKNIEGFGEDRLGGQNYRMTIAGGSTDHPAYAMFLQAAKILNSAGMEVKVVTSQTALSDLSSGKLSIWAAAWSSTIDPDMYQVYHMDSQASSTLNWGYKQIKAGKNSAAYSDEYALIQELSELIDAGRSTTDKETRKAIYKEALDKIMELAVEMPTYQRKDMSAYNKKILDESTMTPEKDRSPYNGLLSRIWELSYN